MKLDVNSGLLVEELRNGFLGLPVIYFLWHGKRLIATSTDRKNWRMSINTQQMSDKSLKSINKEMYDNLSRIGDT